MADSIARALAHIGQLKRLKKLRDERRASRSVALDFSAYRDDPVGFAFDVFGVFLWSRQAEIARALAVHDRVAVKSGHKTGKSFLIAVVVWWWCCTRVLGQAYVTNASWLQVEEALWPDVRRLWYLALARGYRISPHEPVGPTAGVHWPDGRKIVCFSTNRPERAAGFSGPEMLFALDEASGIGSAIFEAITGNTMGGAKQLLTGNPTLTSGVLYEAFTEKAALYSTHTISSAETPNATSDDKSTWIPGAADKAKIAELLAEYGVDSPFADVRIHGNFPTAGANVAITLKAIEAAQKRHAIPELWIAGTTPKPERLRVGVDVARFGDDDSVIYMIRGYRTVKVHAVHGHDTQQLAGLVRRLVAEEVARYGRERMIRNEPQPPIVKVDGIGVGAGVVDALRVGVSIGEIVDVNASEVANDETLYRLSRDEMWFAARDWIRDGGTLPPEEKLLSGELSACLYKFDARGRYVVESKDELKARIKRSPDHADALCLAVYEPARQVARSFRIKGL